MKRAKPTPPAFVEAWGLWPRRDRSAKAKALAVWKRHGADEVLKLAAVRAYVEGRDANEHGGRFVFAFERWLTEKLDSFLELATERNARAASAAEADARRAVNMPAWWRAARDKIAARFPKEFAAYYARCEVVSDAPPTIRTATGYAAQRIGDRDAFLAREVDELLGFALIVLAPETARSM